MPLIALVGFGLGGGLGWWNVDLDLFDARYTWPTMVLYLLVVMAPLRFVQLRQIDPLPVSRRWLFAASVLPYLIVTLIAYGIGAAGAARWTARADMVGILEGTEGSWVTIPVGHMRIARNGAPPR